MNFKKYYKHFFVLDIETYTTFEDDEPIDVVLTFGNVTKYDPKGQVITRFIFRDWDQLRHKLNLINKGKLTAIIFVHNLSYEFDFLIKNVAPPEKVLSNSNHSVISATLKGFGNIEFRCTYQLSFMSLKKLGEIVGLPKLEAEYIKIEAGSEIPAEYLEYNFRDSDIVAKYVIKELKTYNSFSNLPYTKTGKVRQQIIKRYTGDNWDITPSFEHYLMYKDAFSGGLAIANPRYTGVILNNIKSYDRKSAYPYELLTNVFPTCTEESNSKELQGRFITDITFDNISSKYEWGWLSISKNSEEKNAVYFNGKLIKADSIRRTVCEVDFEMIKETYTFSGYTINKLLLCKGLTVIPSCIKDTILFAAEKKSKLKEKVKHNPDNIDLQFEYMLAKSDLNSIYGAMVQKLETPEVNIDSLGVWTSREGKYIGEGKHIKRNFLFGLYTTAYARRALLKTMINHPNSIVLTDTDSVKGTFNTLNGYGEPIYNMGEGVFGFGEWENEGVYESFITFGAKKYAYIKDGKSKFVVAGLPKGNYAFERFRIGETFKKCKTGKKYLYSGYSLELNFNEEPINVKRINSMHGGVALYPADYTLDMSDNDKYFLKTIYKREV